MGVPMRMQAMVRFCFDEELENIIDDRYVDYGSGIRILIGRKKTDEEKIELLGRTYAKAQWMIDYMANLESLKTKAALQSTTT